MGGEDGDHRDGATAKYLGLESGALREQGRFACATCDGALPRFRNKPLVVVGGAIRRWRRRFF